MAKTSDPNELPSRPASHIRSAVPTRRSGNTTQAQWDAQRRERKAQAVAAYEADAADRAEREAKAVEIVRKRAGNS